MQAHSIYLHIPFCHHLCSYCDFNTYAGLDDLIPAYIEALCQEIEFVANSCEQRLPVHTIFFGGGTPSVLPIVGMEKILHQLNQDSDFREGVEVSMEANPGRLTYEYLKSLHDLGINRLSLGMQSANAEDLQLLDRQHEYDQVAKAVNQVRKAGFDNYNLDLIFGIPRQTPEMWQKSLELGLSLDPDHLSLYALTIEPDTLLGSRVSKGLLPEPDPDVSAMMYEMAAELLNPKGYEQYEISNWAKRDDEQGTLACQHNLQYWRNLPYLGLGAGAHGFAGGQRTSNVLKPSEYIQKLQTFDEGNDQDEFPFPKTPAAAKVTTIERDEEIKETMMMGLRLTEEGITRQDFLARFGTTPESVYDQEIAELIGLGLLEWDQKTNERLRLTPRGRILGNQVFLRFV
jgi:oxygen-independent coproporphyrinogen-3 oxidase